jgi:hypothetical protein
MNLFIEFSKKDVFFLFFFYYTVKSVYNPKNDGSNPQSTALEASMLTITPTMRSIKLDKIDINACFHINPYYITFRVDHLKEK